MKSLFNDISNTREYSKKRLHSDDEMFCFLRNFITLTETDCTPYKYKRATYNKKAHYINGKKVNRQVYNYVKKWMISQEKESNKCH